MGVEADGDQSRERPWRSVGDGGALLSADHMTATVNRTEVYAVWALG